MRACKKRESKDSRFFRLSAPLHMPGRRCGESIHRLHPVSAPSPGRKGTSIATTGT